MVSFDEKVGHSANYKSVFFKNKEVHIRNRELSK